MEWHIGKIKIQLAIQDWFRLDGGIIYSGIPKDLWQNFTLGAATHLDQRNRVQLSINSYLLTTPNHHILVDASIGSVRRWKAETQDQFHLENGFNFFECGHANHLLPQPQFVIPTHLHFDHAGGIVKLEDGKLIPAFPNAIYIFHEEEMAHAFEGHPKSRASYRRETIEGVKALIEQKRVSTIIGEEFSLCEGVTLIRTRGHTPGHLSVKIESEGHTALIPGALFPTRWHINFLPCQVANDVYPLDGIKWKLQFLEQALKEHWLMLLEHDPEVAGYVIKTGKDSYAFAPFKPDQKPSN